MSQVTRINFAGARPAEQPWAGRGVFTMRSMWLFERRQQAPRPSGPPSYSQVDITNGFDDNLRLGPEDWIETLPLNQRLEDSGKNPQEWGLSAVGVGEDEVYEVAARLSSLRERMPFPDEGVYCPICHIANTQIARLRTPCPRCGRPLLQFGWN